MQELNGKTDIELDLEIKYKEDNFELFKHPLKTSIKETDIKSLANDIIELANSYAYELDTSTDNIDMKITNFRILKTWKEN